MTYTQGQTAPVNDIGFPSNYYKIDASVTPADYVFGDSKTVVSIIVAQEEYDGPGLGIGGFNGPDSLANHAEAMNYLVTTRILTGDYTGWLVWQVDVTPFQRYGYAVNES